MDLQLSEQETFRREALAAIRNSGINPYPADQVPVNFLAKTIKSEFPAAPETFLLFVWPEELWPKE